MFKQVFEGVSWKFHENFNPFSQVGRGQMSIMVKQLNVREGEKEKLFLAEFSVRGGGKLPPKS